MSWSQSNSPCQVFSVLCIQISIHPKSSFQFGYLNLLIFYKKKILDYLWFNVNSVQFKLDSFGRIIFIATQCFSFVLPCSAKHRKKNVSTQIGKIHNEVVYGETFVCTCCWEKSTLRFLLEDICMRPCCAKFRLSWLAGNRLTAKMKVFTVFV